MKNRKNKKKHTEAIIISDAFPSFPFSSHFWTLWGPKWGGYLVRAGSFCYFYSVFLTILKVHYADLARARLAVDAMSGASAPAHFC